MKIVHPHLEDSRPTSTRFETGDLVKLHPRFAGPRREFGPGLVIGSKREIHDFKVEVVDLDDMEEWVVLVFWGDGSLTEEDEYELIRCR